MKLPDQRPYPKWVPIVIAVAIGVALVYLLAPRVVDAAEIFVMVWPFLGSETALYFAWEALWLPSA